MSKLNLYQCDRCSDKFDLEEGQKPDTIVGLDIGWLPKEPALCSPCHEAMQAYFTGRKPAIYLAEEHEKKFLEEVAEESV